jgi:hypothetical protein
MERSQLFRLIQEKVDAEIGNRTTGEILFRIQMNEGGIRQCELQVVQKKVVQ